MNVSVSLTVWVVVENTATAFQLPATLTVGGSREYSVGGDSSALVDHRTPCQEARLPTPVLFQRAVHNSSQSEFDRLSSCVADALLTLRNICIHVRVESHCLSTLVSGENHRGESSQSL